LPRLRGAAPVPGVRLAGTYQTISCLGGEALVDKYGNPWPRYRVYPPKILPPLRAVRHRCLDCVCELPEEVKVCPVTDCPLWPFRFGKYPEDHQGPKSVLKPIRAKCLDCSGSNRAEVRRCPKKCCPIFPFRKGTNPRRAGKGGIPNAQTGAENSKTPTQKHEIDLKVK
jgi:hypothetical protein